MVRFGYTLMGEQAGPRDLVEQAVSAERAGFDFAVASDHYFPWVVEQGHSPYVWSVLGAVAARTERIPLMTYVTCPILRYHPAVVAQKAATVQLLSEGRFTLGLGAGESLNEHIVGPFPPVRVRHEMLAEAVEIIRALFGGGYVTYRGRHFSVESARLWDVPEEAPPIGVAVSGRHSWTLAGRLADAVIATEPKPELLRGFAAEGGAGKPAIGQLPVSYDPDREVAVDRAYANFRWFSGGWKVNSELGGPAAFDAAARGVRRADVAAQIPCGSDPQVFAEAVRPYLDAGFGSVALVQAGEEGQEAFIEWAGRELLPVLRSM